MTCQLYSEIVIILLLYHILSDAVTKKLTVVHKSHLQLQIEMLVPRYLMVNLLCLYNARRCFSVTYEIILLVALALDYFSH